MKQTEITFGTALTIGGENAEQKYADSMVDTAWELGIRSFDTANSYGNGHAEKLMGIALKKYPREEFILSTKVYWPVGNEEIPYNKGLSRKHVLWQIDESLKRLQMDYVDLYYAHRYDPEVSMEEIVRTFNDLIRWGKIRYWGTSQWPLEKLEECHQVCVRLGLEKPIVEQCAYSFAERKIEQNGIREFCENNAVGILAFYPLSQGWLTGKYRKGVSNDSRLKKVDKVISGKMMDFYKQHQKMIDGMFETCDKYNVEPTNLALKWCLRNGIYPVLGASSPEQLRKTISCLDEIIPDIVWEELG